MIDKDKWMNLALEEAYKAEKAGEVPVGAVVVNSNGELISRAHNLKEKTHDPCGHAEVLALKMAAQKLGTWRLSGCWLFVTLEPCMMCTGAIIQSRLCHVVFGANDPKSGFVSSTANGLDDFKTNHHPKWEGGIETEKCSTVLKNFFKLKRYDNKNS